MKRAGNRSFPYRRLEMFYNYYHHPFYGIGGRRYYPWGGYGWPAYATGGYGPYGPGIGVGAVQTANNVWAGNFNRTAYSNQRLINTGDMEDTEQTSTPTVIG
jgi:hypothetical protein